MFDAPAQRLVITAGLVGFEDAAVGEIADGVDGELDIGGLRLRHEGGEAFIVEQRETGRIRTVGVGLDQLRAAAAEGAVHIEFHGAVGDRAGLVEAAFGNREGAGVKRVVEAQRQAPFPVERGHQRRFTAGDAHVVPAGPAARGIELRAGFEGEGNSGVVRLGDQRLDEAHGGVDQDAGRLAVCAAFDLAAGRVGGLVRDAGCGKDGGVGNEGMAVRAAEDDLVAAADGIEIGRHRHAAFRPAGFDPAAPDEDGAFRLAFEFSFDAGDEFGHRGGAFEVERQFALADAE